jgi:ABC-type bacteriocin/lantibiotic exporter with double-glycine peptidase domain
MVTFSRWYDITFMDINDQARGGLHLLKDFLYKRWRRALLIFSLDLVANILTIALSLLFAQALAQVFGFKSVRSSLVGWQSSNTLGCIVTVIVIKFFLDYYRYLLRHLLGEDLVFDLRREVFGHHLTFREQDNSARHLLRYTGDMGSIQRLLQRGILQFIADLVLLFVGAIFIIWQDWRMGILVGLLITIGSGISRMINRRLKKAEESRRNKKADMVSMLSMVLSNLSGIQALNREKRIFSYFDTVNKKMRDTSGQYIKIAASSEALPLSLVHLLVFSALITGWRSGWPADHFFAAIIVLMSWRSALSRLLKAGLIWEKGILSLEKMYRLLQRPKLEEGHMQVNKKEMPHLQLEEVVYKVNQNQQLGPFTLDLQCGNIVGLTGGTGSGKTTLVKLLAGLYQPHSGVVRWSGISSTLLTAHNIRLQASYVSAAFPLFGKRLSDALSNSSKPGQLKNIEARFIAWQSIFPALQNLDFYQKLKGLSTGQSQILQIFRAISTEKPFLILDEPFVGLDRDTIQKLAGLLYDIKDSTGILLLTAHPEVLLDTALHNVEIVQQLRACSGFSHCNKFNVKI